MCVKVKALRLLIYTDKVKNFKLKLLTVNFPLMY